MKKYIILLSLFYTCAVLAQKEDQQAEEYTLEHYIAYSNGTALDKKTGLLWKRCSVGQKWEPRAKNCIGKPAEFNWNEAMELSSSKWRLPTQRELATLVRCQAPKGKGIYLMSPNREGCLLRDGVVPIHQQKYHMNINNEVFPNSASKYWTSSPVGEDRLIWTVYFLTGNSYDYDYDFQQTYHIRLVHK